MNWITIKDISELPRDQQFLALWKGSICIAEYDEDEEHFYLCMFPSVYPTVMKVSKEREGKFTHYMKLELPSDY